jgi:hypothetical protein
MPWPRVQRPLQGRAHLAPRTRAGPRRRRVRHQGLRRLVQPPPPKRRDHQGQHLRHPGGVRSHLRPSDSTRHRGGFPIVRAVGEPGAIHPPSPKAPGKPERPGQKEADAGRMAHSRRRGGSPPKAQGPAARDEAGGERAEGRGRRAGGRPPLAEKVKGSSRGGLGTRVVDDLCDLHEIYCGCDTVKLCHLLP